MEDSKEEIRFLSLFSASIVSLIVVDHVLVNETKTRREGETYPLCQRLHSFIRDGLFSLKTQKDEWSNKEKNLGERNENIVSPHPSSIQQLH